MAQLTYPMKAKLAGGWFRQRGGCDWGSHDCPRRSKFDPRGGLDGGQRDVERLRDLLVVEATEAAQLDDLDGARVDGLGLPCGRSAMQATCPMEKYTSPESTGNRPHPRWVNSRSAPTPFHTDRLLERASSNPATRLAMPARLLPGRARCAGAGRIRSARRLRAPPRPWCG